MFPFPSFYFYTYLTLVKGSEKKNQWQPLYFQFLLSVHIFPFLPSVLVLVSISFPPAPQLILALGTFENKGKRKKKKKKDQKASLLAGNNQEISKHSWFAIGLNERTAFLIFFPLFLLNCLVFLSFHLFVLVSLCLSVITIVLNVLCQNWLLASLPSSFFPLISSPWFRRLILISCCYFPFAQPLTTSLLSLCLPVRPFVCLNIYSSVYYT